MIDRPTPYLKIRKTETLVRGEPVWVVGNPLLAFKETVTSGNFSRIFPEKDFKKELKIKAPYKGDWIQFSAPVIGGNSGGRWWTRTAGSSAS
jgi:S1-C subfamily serine protease